MASGSWCAQGFVWARWVSLAGMEFDSKRDFSPPTILLGLLLCPWMWVIFFWWDPTFSCWWLFSSELQFWSSFRRRWAHVLLLCHLGTLVGEARILEWVAIPFSRGSSQAKVWTQVSHDAGGLFTSWAMRKPKNTGVGSLSLLLQWIFLIQEWTQGLLHYRKILYKLSYQGRTFSSLVPSNIKYIT